MAAHPHDSDASPPLDHPVCEADEGDCFYIAPIDGSGAGSWDEPFGLDDLPDPSMSSCQLASAAFEALDTGDILSALRTTRAGRRLRTICAAVRSMARRHVHVRAGTYSAIVDVPYATTRWEFGT